MNKHKKLISILLLSLLLSVVIIFINHTFANPKSTRKSNCFFHNNAVMIDENRTGCSTKGLPLSDYEIDIYGQNGQWLPDRFFANFIFWFVISFIGITIIKRTTVSLQNQLQATGKIAVFSKTLGALLMISGGLVVIPQLINLITNTIIPVGYYFYLNIITHYGGILTGSLVIPIYISTYFFKGFVGFGLVVAAILNIKYGRSLMRLNLGVIKKLLFVQVFIVLLFLILLSEWGIDYFISIAFAGILPPVAVALALLVLNFLSNRSRQSVNNFKKLPSK